MTKAGPGGPAFFAARKQEPASQPLTSLLGTAFGEHSYEYQ